MSKIDEKKKMEEQKREIIEIVSKIKDENILKELYEEICKALKEFMNEIEDVDTAKEIYEELREILEESEKDNADRVES